MIKIPTTFSAALLLAVAVLLGACQQDPFEDWQSHERAITDFTLPAGQMGPAVIDRAESKVTITVLVEDEASLQSLAPTVLPSYKATVNPASGEAVNFTANNNRITYTVTSESGQVREWTVELIPFVETLLGTYDITDLVVYGGTGPEYGGGGVLSMTEKPWAWPEAGGPEAELDNTLTFAYSGVTEEGNTYGTITNHAGADGEYANFYFNMSPRTDVNHHYRKIPTGEGTWLRDYANNTVTFTFADGTFATGTLIGPGTTALGNGLSKTITHQAFAFTLDGTDDWDNIYSDYDKFVQRPRQFWIEVQKQD